MDLVQGIDDDAAVIAGPNGKDWLVTTDLLVEGVHFKRSWADWKTVGRKALLANISDIAAMGGVPDFYFVSISSPKYVSKKNLLDFYGGMAEAAGAYGLTLVGGDTSASKGGFFVSLTVIGSVRRGGAVYRRGAAAGDRIYVSGRLGASKAGVYCLEKGLSGGKFSGLVERHLNPVPRVRLGRYLAHASLAASMIDISDGLAIDLGHIADSSGVGYKLFAGDIPIEEGVQKVAKMAGCSALDFAATSGEEYELLFTVSGSRAGELASGMRKEDFGCEIREIGEIVSDAGSRDILDEKGEKVEIAGSCFVHDIGGCC